MFVVLEFIIFNSVILVIKIEEFNKVFVEIDFSFIWKCLMRLLGVCGRRKILVLGIDLCLEIF